MLQKKLRLPGAKFREVGYETTRTPFFSLKARPNGEKNDRIGIVAGMAVHKSAAKRNFWKRQTKGTFSRVTKTGKNNGGRDILVILSSKVNTLTKKQFQEKLSAALARVDQ